MAEGASRVPRVTQSIRRGASRAPGTVVLVAVTGVLALCQHVLAPLASIPTGWLVETFAVHSTAPTAIRTWVTAPLFHLSIPHFLKNLGPLVAVCGYLEARYGTSTWLLTCTVLGAVAHGAFATLVAMTVDASWAFVGASTIWYGTIAFLALNGDEITVSIPGGHAWGPRQIVVPFRYCFVGCLGYTLLSIASGGILTPGVVPTLHLVSLGVGTGWWTVYGSPRLRSPRSERAPNGRPVSRR